MTSSTQETTIASKHNHSACKCGRSHEQPSFADPDNNADAVISAATGAALLRSADAIVIGAGAGASIASGIDYADRVKFQKQFPGLVAKGFGDYWSMIGADVTPTEQWAYLSQHILSMRFDTPSHGTYEALRRLVGDTPHFVLTSNVDGQFEKAGFDPKLIVTPQGDFALLQCSHCRSTWPSRPAMEQIAATVNHETCECDEALVPTCETCGRPAEPHVNGGSWFVHEKHDAQWKAFYDFLSANRDKNVVLIDIGSGFNTPGVVRFRLDKFAGALPHATLVRLNSDYPHVPLDLARQGKAKMLPLTFQEFANDVV